MERIETQWSVFTGAPRSGKSSVLQELKRAGFPIRKEFSRRYIDQSKAKGITLEQLTADQQALQSTFLHRGLNEDALLDPTRPYLLDRSPVDAVAHYMLYELQGTTDAVIQASRFRYRNVFYFEPLPFEHDGTRIEKDADEARRLQELFCRAYEAVGYHVIQVPVMTINDRVALIMSHLKS